MSNPNDPVLLDEGKRHKVELNGENYYFYISTNRKSITVTVPDEGQNFGERVMVDKVATMLSKLLGGE